MIFLLKSLAALIVVLMVATLVLFRVDESRVGNTRIPVGTSRGAQIVCVVYHSSIANLLRRFSFGQLYAITFWNRIYVTSDYITPENRKHEVEHVRQWHRYGPIGFPIRYLYLLFRQGYLKHPMEIAARTYAGQTPWLR